MDDAAWVLAWVAAMIKAAIAVAIAAVAAAAGQQYMELAYHYEVEYISF